MQRFACTVRLVEQKRSARYKIDQRRVDKIKKTRHVLSVKKNKAIQAVSLLRMRVLNSHNQPMMHWRTSMKRSRENTLTGGLLYDQ